MNNIGITVGSTRPGRRGEAVANWVFDQMSALGGAYFELIDIKNFDLPLYDEPNPPYLEQYNKEHIKKSGQRRFVAWMGISS